jgi:hypothetical protein
MMNEEQSKAINESLAANVLRLGNECRALADENARLKAEAGITFRRLVLDHAGKTIEFVAKPLHDELAAELRFSESRVAMLRAELERREERIRALVEEYSKK